MTQYICYCNKVTEEDIRIAIQDKNAQTIGEVIQITGAMKNSNCALNNPKGTCCYSDILTMFQKYSCKAKLKITYALDSIGELESPFHYNSNRYYLNPITLNNWKFHHYHIESGTIQPLYNNDNTIATSINVDILFVNALEEKECLKFAKLFCEYFTCILAFFNDNSYYGTTLIKPIWHTWDYQLIYKYNRSKKSLISLYSGHKTYINPDLSPYFSLSIQRNYYTELFFAGLEANSDRTKFLFWFLILEDLESSDSYKKMFKNNNLFTQDDRNQIANLFPKAESSEKYEKLQNTMATATIKSRSDKLFEFLIDSGLSEYGTSSNRTKLTVEDCKKLIKQRNAVAHGKAMWDFRLTCNVLFEIVSEIIRITSFSSPLKNP